MQLGNTITSRGNNLKYFRIISVNYKISSQTILIFFNDILPE